MTSRRTSADARGSAGTSTGNGYWNTQILICALAGTALIDGGLFVLGSDAEEKGAGLLYLLIGVGFLFLLRWLVRSFTRLSPTERAVYAWAIMQQYRPLARNDASTMRAAALARDGRLTRAEIERLQELRPHVRYPGEWPEA